mmetsp:Transcript_16075/g.51286  ORF Transcript_16075/g.51286 Transcript_16075/m.51286 type:complete len:223 (+) Transcript_16075:1375-2043(+)
MPIFLLYPPLGHGPCSLVALFSSRSQTAARIPRHARQPRLRLSIATGWTPRAIPLHLAEVAVDHLLPAFSSARPRLRLPCCLPGDPPPAARGIRPTSGTRPRAALNAPATSLFADRAIHHYQSSHSTSKQGGGGACDVYIACTVQACTGYTPCGACACKAAGADAGRSWRMGAHTHTNVKMKSVLLCALAGNHETCKHTMRRHDRRQRQSFTCHLSLKTPFF